jgi:hypothetical protein
MDFIYHPFLRQITSDNHFLTLQGKMDQQLLPTLRSAQSDSLKRLLEDEPHSDIVLVSADGRELSAHKAILAAP